MGEGGAGRARGMMYAVNRIVVFLIQRGTKNHSHPAGPSGMQQNMVLLFQSQLADVGISRMLRGLASHRA